MNSKLNGPPVIIEQTLSRRDLFEWLGKSAVIAFGAELMGACATSPYPEENDASALSSGGSATAGGSVDGRDTELPGHVDLPDGGEASACDAPSAFPFQPGQPKGGVFEGWGERTVDSQELSAILASWKLVVDGLVDKPVTLTFQDVLRLARQDQITDFHCVEGWSIYDVPWSGVHLATLFALVKPKTSATHVTFHTIGDTYNESLPIKVALEPKTLLAYGINCATIPLKHGFPLRIVAPRLYGYKYPKFVYRIELTDQPVNGYWVNYGYPYDGEVAGERLRPGKY